MRIRYAFLWVWLPVLWTAHVAEAQVTRFAVIIGNNQGEGDEQTLRYAESDAVRVYDVLKDLGGFHPENMVLLRGEQANTVRRALIAVNDRIRSGVPSADQALVFVYYSGHADAESLHLGGTSLPLDEIRQLVRGSAADFRLFVLDSCRSGALTRVKGGRRVPPFDMVLDRKLASEGAVFLTASAANEDAQESDALRGSFFTHYLVSGLLGGADTNGDGRVVIDEAYRHAYENTLRASSRTLAGTQHPTFQYDLSGKGEVALTFVGDTRHRGVLALPPGNTFLVFQETEEGSVIAEVGVHSRVRQVNLSPGRYFLRGRARDHLLEGSVHIAAGQRLRVNASELEKIEYARLVRKGDGVASLSHGPSVGVSVHSRLDNSDAPCFGAFVGWSLHFRSLSSTFRSVYCRSSFSNNRIDATVDEAELDVRLGHVWDMGHFGLEPAVHLGSDLFHQRFESRGVAPPRTSAGGHVGAGLAGSLALPRGFVMGTELSARTYLFRKHAAPPDQGVSLATSFAVHVSMSVGKLLR